ncbi:MFS transporter [Streptantibioticus rubrisoli]|uniref:MFS transporter n=1 Tax=Streptantibioticus rubrisoli TaxID=1387313 RepID=A0ABT1PMG5_9ACTN|nr:MFS transporter [Streptantibioticus rubrisoli]MCQ4046556.1 MFS transporter [Streptantibioticus rubrisoli]
MSLDGLKPRAAVADPAPSRAASRLPLVALCLGFFMVMLDATVVAVALPPIGRDFGSGGDLAGAQWVADGYTIVFAGLLLSAGSVGDRLGSKPVFQAGLGSFVATSVGCGMAPSLWFLVLMRLLQGLAAALVVPTSLALIHASYANKEDRARAIGVWGGIGGIAAASGPVLGGLLVSAFGWRSVFYVNLPFGLLGIALTARYVVAPRQQRVRGMDLPAQILGILALGAITFAIIEGGHRGWYSSMVLAAFALFVICGTAFVLVEQRVPNPMLPLSLFRHVTFSSATAVGLLLNIGFYGQLFVVTFYFQQYRHYAVLWAGLAILPQTAMAGLASALGGRMTARTGPRAPMTLGLLIGAAGFFALLVAGRSTPYWALVLPLGAIGFGTAFTMPAAVASVVESAPPNRSGVASGVLNASRQVGSAVGVALLGALVADAGHFESGMRAGSLISGGCFVVGALIAQAAGGGSAEDARG